MQTVLNLIAYLAAADAASKRGSARGGPDALFARRLQIAPIRAGAVPGGVDEEFAAVPPVRETTQKSELLQGSSSNHWEFALRRSPPVHAMQLALSGASSYNKVCMPTLGCFTSVRRAEPSISACLCSSAKAGGECRAVDLLKPCGRTVCKKSAEPALGPQTRPCSYSQAGRSPYRSLTKGALLPSPSLSGAPNGPL